MLVFQAVNAVSQAKDGADGGSEMRQRGEEKAGRDEGLRALGNADRTHAFRQSHKKSYGNSILFHHKPKIGYIKSVGAVFKTYRIITVDKVILHRNLHTSCCQHACPCTDMLRPLW